jgi:hypothetical protein
MVNNSQDEHYSTVLETSCMIADQNYSVLIDPGGTKSFISIATLNRIKVNKFEQDEFKYVETTSGAKQKV